MRIYLDNCVFNRPFDNQSYLRVWLASRRVNAIKLRQKGDKMGRRERQKRGGGRNEQG